MKLLKSINLKEQLTNELKGKWYYQQIEWGLKVNKHSVVFDKIFRFELEEYDWHDELLGIDIYVKFQGETIINDECIGIYGLGKYQERPCHILDDICCFIANRI